MEKLTKTQTRAVLVAAVSMLLLVAQGLPMAFADQPMMSSLDIDETNTVTSLCDFPLTVTQEGTLKTSLYFNHDGQITRISENWQDVRSTLTNDETGRSLTYRNAGRDGFTFEQDGGFRIYTQGVRGLVTVPGSGAVFGEAGNITVTLSPDGEVDMSTSGFSWDGDFSIACDYLSGEQH